MLSQDFKKLPIITTQYSTEEMGAAIKNVMVSSSKKKDSGKVLVLDLECS